MLFFEHFYRNYDIWEVFLEPNCAHIFIDYGQAIENLENCNGNIETLNTKILFNKHIATNHEKKNEKIPLHV